MKLSALRVILAPRRGWEALDLGLALLVRWRAAVYLPWLICMLPLVGFLCFALQDWPAMIPITILWLKPLTDRVVLFVLSRAVFGPLPSLSQVLMELPQLLGRRVFRALFSQRFSMRRNLVMPVDLLEAPRGRERSARLKVLSRGDAGGTSSSCLVLFAHFEFALACSILLLLVTFGPDSWSQAYSFFLEYSEVLPLLQWHWTCSYLVAWLLLEPAFVAAGFGLYLCRRTELEGWDLELGFRELAKRIEAEAKPARAPGGASRSAGLMLLLGLLVFGASEAQAQEPEPSAARRMVLEVLDGEEFNQTVTSRTWVSDLPDSSPLDGMLVGGATILVWLAFAVFLILVIAAAARFARTRERKLIGVKTKPRPVTHAFGLDLRAESLPSDPAAQARVLWQAGQLREALSLLYRCALADLVRSDGLQLVASDTEFDAAQRVAQLEDEDKAAFFLRLTETWLYSAWGARLPAAEGGAGLVSEWTQHFGGRP